MVFGCCRWTEHISRLQHNYLKKMTLLHILLSILGTLSWATEVVTTTPPVDIYWNSTNNIFQRTNNDHIVQVQIKERIKFLCPYYEPGEQNMEHYLIYRLPKHYYDACYIPQNANEAQLREFGIEKVHNCSSPQDPSVFISYIDSFIPLPGNWGGLKYEAGKEYYFTSISTGSVAGLHNRLSEPSACKRFNMKAIVRVCCNDTFTDPPLVTGDPVQTPPTMERIPSTASAATPPTEPTTISWSTVRSTITSKKNPVTSKPTENEKIVRDSASSQAASMTSLVLGLILSRVILELT